MFATVEFSHVSKSSRIFGLITFSNFTRPIPFKEVIFTRGMDFPFLCNYIRGHKEANYPVCLKHKFIVSKI